MGKFAQKAQKAQAQKAQAQKVQAQKAVGGCTLVDAWLPVGPQQQQQQKASSKAAPEGDSTYDSPDMARAMMAWAYEWLANQGAGGASSSSSSGSSKDAEVQPVQRPESSESEKRKMIAAQGGVNKTIRKAIEAAIPDADEEWKDLLDEVEVSQPGLDSIA